MNRDETNMIDYYNHHMPPEIRDETLKHLPNYRRVNQSLYRDHQTHLERFCHLPISYYELKQYLLTLPEYIVIFTPEQDSFSAILIRITSILTLRGTNKNQYVVFRYHFTTTGPTIENISINDIEKYLSKNSYYDLHTTVNILKERQCPKHEIAKQLMKIIEPFKHDGDYLHELEKYFLFQTSITTPKILAEPYHIDVHYDYLKNVVEDLIHKL